MKKQFFNKKQLDELKQYELHFYTAVKENYKRATPAALNDKIADVYEEMTGIKLNRNWSCGTCVLNAFKAVGQLYFDSKKHYEELQAQQLTFDFDGAKNAAPVVSDQVETEPDTIQGTSAKTVAKNKQPKKGRKNKKQ